jgi:G3E family GTPase
MTATANDFNSKKARLLSGDEPKSRIQETRFHIASMQQTQKTAGISLGWERTLFDGHSFDYLLVESTGLSEPLPLAEPRLGRRTALTFPLLPPPQKN